VDIRLEELLRRLALNDEATLESALHADLSNESAGGLDAKSSALVRLAGLIAVRSAPASYEWGVSAALAAGATDDEIVGVLLAVSAVVGAGRASCAAADIARALGHEVDLPQ
jgi:alkylhydroperoxidase/carboxymuconolactone decarboxylase family protein YurZ